MEESSKKKPQRKQAHQNKFSFQPNPKSKLTKKISAIPIVDLCKRCKDKILWKKQYKKYKIQNHLSKCTVCLEKSITLAYNIVCDPCGIQKNICRVCRILLTQEAIQGYTPLEKAPQTKVHDKLPFNNASQPDILVDSPSNNELVDNASDDELVDVSEIENREEILQ
ncbi:hypothetical protein NEFER03_0302 [Nematocida sp. LUAm3]|nr:hypothetical protein NEFER03_0302 [Nematocida sp. LUAm3]KAI5173754.1 hypothetical protein NEFER02_0270 [Nematocida sp. LUAm2]KAI5176977.1 hypothetical protein NEFER01_0302 [Nematocida sp. LUAm1]